MFVTGIRRLSTVGGGLCRPYPFPISSSHAFTMGQLNRMEWPILTTPGTRPRLTSRSQWRRERLVRADNTS